MDVRSLKKARRSKESNLLTIFLEYRQMQDSHLGRINAIKQSTHVQYMKQKSYTLDPIPSQAHARDFDQTKLTECYD